MSSGARLSVVKLKAYYASERGPIHAVDEVGLEIEKGECLAIVGESGCGKSTLGSAIIRALQYPGQIVGGDIVLNNNDIGNIPLKLFDSNIRWKKISMVFQGAMNALDPVYPIRKQMIEILKVHKFAGDYETKINDSLSSVGLEKAVASLYPHELSGGMKQRVVIAMALMLEPEVLIADEPTTALDVLVQRDIIDLLKKMQQEKGISILIISHDVALVFQIASRIAIMYAGQIVEIAPSHDVSESPKHPYTRALINSIPRLGSRSKILNYVSGRPPNLLNPPPGCRFRDRCSEAMDICNKDPPEVPISGGFVRCWLYDSDHMQRRGSSANIK